MANNQFQEVVHKALDANRYASKKTLAQGMLDIALLTANASQLKYILQVGQKHEFYTLMVTLISVSIILQVVLGCLALSLNMLRDCRLHKIEYRYSALCLNYLSLAGAFIVSAVNLLIAVFNPRPTHPAASMVVGGLLVLLGSLNINKERDQRKADVVNDISTGFVFIITILNVVISGFGLESYPQMLKNLHREDIVEP